MVTALIVVRNTIIESLRYTPETDIILYVNYTST